MIPGGTDHSFPFDVDAAVDVDVQRQRRPDAGKIERDRCKTNVPLAGIPLWKSLSCIRRDQFAGPERPVDAGLHLEGSCAGIGFRPDVRSRNMRPGNIQNPA
jgi:hypothetical protein